MVEVGRDLDDPMAEPDVLGPLACSRKEYLGCARVRVLLQKVMLDLPDVVKADLVRELDLLERVAQQLLLRPFVPGPRQLMLVEDPESHEFEPYSARPAGVCSP